LYAASVRRLIISEYRTAGLPGLQLPPDEPSRDRPRRLRLPAFGEYLCSCHQDRNRVTYRGLAPSDNKGILILRYLNKTMTKTAKQILDQYVSGKDTGKYQILETIFADSAEVEFEIRSDTISFPEKIHGKHEIARILSRDFNKKYERVRTYYLKSIDQESETIDNQPWLVVMKEIGSDSTRIGTGYYNWSMLKTESSLKISKLKIYIHEMLALTDSKSTTLSEIQNKIEYPWPENLAVIEALSPYEALDAVTNYIKNYSR